MRRKWGLASPESVGSALYYICGLWSLSLELSSVHSESKDRTNCISSVRAIFISLTHTLLSFSPHLSYVLLLFFPLHIQQLQHIHTHSHTHIRAETQRSKEMCRATFWDFLCWFMGERFRHATQDEANEWNVKILWNSKNKTTQGLPFEEIIGARLGVEQIKQTVLYTQQQPE